MEATKRTSGFAWEWTTTSLTVLLCLAPLILLWERFRALYWFHDDWGLISQMQSSGPLAWMTERYGENFAPVFKLFWQGAIAATGGSYTGMIVVLWVTHSAILFLLADVLRRCGFPGRWQCLAIVTLGLPWSNIESLGWASCWISLLNILFFLLAWTLLLRSETHSGFTLAFPFVLLAVLLCALTFSRGVFAGALLAFFVIHSARVEKRLSRARVWAAGGLALVSAIAVVPYGWMLEGYGGFSGLSAQRVGSMASFAAHYALLNPLYQLMPMPHRSVGALAMLLAGLPKVLILGAGIRFSSGRQRSLLWTLLLFDLVMAVLVGVGRYDRDILTAASYRYQYPSLLCFGPFLAITVGKGLELFRKAPLRSAAFAAIFAGWACLIGIPWAHYIPGWSESRGTEIRAALASAAPDERFGLAGITAGRARELIRLYNLH